MGSSGFYSLSPPRTSSQWPILLHWIHRPLPDVISAPPTAPSSCSAGQCADSLSQQPQSPASIAHLTIQEAQESCKPAELVFRHDDGGGDISSTKNFLGQIVKVQDKCVEGSGGSAEKDVETDVLEEQTNEDDEGLSERHWHTALHVEEKREKGCFGICSAPGKKSKRQGIHWDRDLSEDLLRLRDHFGVTTILCLMNVYELRSIGVEGYEEAVGRLGMKLLHFPIIEMAAPLSLDVTDDLILGLLERMAEGEVIAIHCRCGLGRSGTIAACILLRLGLCKTAPQAIAKVRSLRSKLAVESWSQEKFVHKYASSICRAE